jgi:hypothetical protein
MASSIGLERKRTGKSRVPDPFVAPQHRRLILVPERIKEALTIRDQPAAGATQEAAMGSLIFPCPGCWHVVDAGIETDAVTLGRIRDCEISAACPHCKRIQKFKIDDGCLFQMRPRRSTIHYMGLLCDEVDAGSVIQRALCAAPSADLPRERRRVT